MKAEGMQEPAVFEVGGRYSARSAMDWNCVFRFEVIKRTAKFITVREEHLGTKRVGVKVIGGRETAAPLGTYSMCAVIYADSPEGGTA